MNPQTLTFTFNMQQLGTIEQGLAELPFKVAQPLFQFLHMEAMRQRAEASKPAPVAVADETATDAA
jgi:hypothetical protein